MTTTIIKITKRVNNVLKEREYPSNSNAVRKMEQRKRDKVIHTGGTRIGKFDTK